MFDDAERAVLRYAKEATETGEVADTTGLRCAAISTCNRPWKLC